MAETPTNSRPAPQASASAAPGRLGGLVYAGLSYVLFLASFTLFAAACSGLWAPWPSSTTLPTAAAVAIDIALVLLFGIQHSVMARPGFKRRWTRIVPKHLERATYVLAASVVLLVVVLFWQPVGGQIWSVEATAGRVVLWALFAVGYLGVVWSTYLIDHFHLFGLQQVWRRFRGKPPSSPEFQEPWAYRQVRHPMMLFLLVMVWSSPAKTGSQALLAGLMSLYVLAGIAFEERGLIEELGEPYREYRRRVPRLIPRPW